MLLVTGQEFQLRGQTDDSLHVLATGTNVVALSDYDRCNPNLSNSKLTPLKAYMMYLCCIGDVYQGFPATVLGDVTTIAPLGATDSTVAPAAASTAAPTVAATVAATVAPIIAVPTTAAPVTAQDIFLWLEWPGPVDPAVYYDSVIAFTRSNAGNYRVTKVIARVNSPDNQANVWQVDSGSIFYVNFLSRLSSNVEVRVLPYLLDSASSGSWVSSMGTSNPLEAVYVYVSRWNALLQGISGYSGPLISGIVTDMEEQSGFGADLSSVPSLQSKYSSPGKPLLKFGTTTGFDCKGVINSLPSYMDEIYVEMYDFYIYGVSPAVLIESTSPGVLNNPSTYLAILESEVWSNYVDSYASSRVQLMWSLQHRGSDCLFPLGSYGCGENNDLGSWDAKSASDFFNLIASKYSVFADREKGFFQFSFMPQSWM